MFEISIKRMLPQLLWIVATVTIFHIDICNLVKSSSTKWKPRCVFLHVLCMVPFAIYLLTNIGRHTTPGSTNNWVISKWISREENDGNMEDVGAEHEVCVRAFPIDTRHPSHLCFILRILLLTIVAILI